MERQPGGRSSIRRKGQTKIARNRPRNPTFLQNRLLLQCRLPSPINRLSVLHRRLNILSKRATCLALYQPSTRYELSGLIVLDTSYLACFVAVFDSNAATVIDAIEQQMLPRRRQILIDRLSLTLVMAVVVDNQDPALH